jgi:hypothetical protein
MLLRFKTVALLGLLILPASLRAEPVPAQFRGCDSAGWCRFRVELRRLEPGAAIEDPIHRVRPLGIPEMRGTDAVSIAVRDRLNALMSSFVHQHKRIVLYDLRDFGDGTYAAHITVNESGLPEDPVLRALAAERR